MKNMISKSKFKPRALHYFREVEQTGRELIISDRGKPVLKTVIEKVTICKKFNRKLLIIDRKSLTELHVHDSLQHNARPAW